MKVAKVFNFNPSLPLVFFKSYRSKWIVYSLDENEKLSNYKKEIFTNLELGLHYRFVFVKDGDEIDDDSTLKSLELQNGGFIRVEDRFARRGTLDIGIFGNHQTSIGREVLISNGERSYSQIFIENLINKIGGDQNARVQQIKGMLNQE